MSLARIASTYLLTTVFFFAVDMLWLGVVAKEFYRKQLGPLLSEQVNWPAAILFPPTAQSTNGNSVCHTADVTGFGYSFLSSSRIFSKEDETRVNALISRNGTTSTGTPFCTIWATCSALGAIRCCGAGRASRALLRFLRALFGVALLGLRLAAGLLRLASCFQLVVADEIAGLRPLAVELSLHGATAETHDRATATPGSFDAMLRGLDRLLGRGVGVVLKTPLTRLNEGEVEGMRRIAGERGVPWRLDPVLTPRDDGDPGPLAFRSSPESVERMFRDLKALGQLPHEERAAGGTNCGLGRTTIAVDPEGNVFPCLQWRRAPLGNVRETPLRAMWAGSEERLAAAAVARSANDRMVEAVFDDLADARRLFAHFEPRPLELVPLLARGDAIGTIGLPAIDPDYVFSESEIELAETVAGQIATTIDNARLYARVEAALVTSFDIRNAFAPHIIGNETLRALDDLINNFLVAMGRQAMHDNGVLAGDAHEQGIDLIGLKRFPALSLFVFLTHAGPDIGIDDIRVPGCFHGIRGH